MSIKEVWCVYGYSPRKDTFMGVFSTKIRADKAAEGKGEWGATGDVKSRQAYYDSHSGYHYLLDALMPIPVDIDNIKAQAKEKRKAELLSSMSEEDKKILGLN